MNQVRNDRNLESSYKKGKLHYNPDKKPKTTPYLQTNRLENAANKVKTLNMTQEIYRMERQLHNPINNKKSKTPPPLKTKTSKDDIRVGGICTSSSQRRRPKHPRRRLYPHDPKRLSLFFFNPPQLGILVVLLLLPHTNPNRDLY